MPNISKDYLDYFFKEDKKYLKKNYPWSGRAMDTKYISRTFPVDVENNSSNLTYVEIIPRGGSSSDIKEFSFSIVDWKNFRPFKTFWIVNTWRNAEHENRPQLPPKPKAPPGIDLGIISGPHFFRWEDNNEVFFEEEILRFARPLPPLPNNEEWNWNNVMRWFFKKTNIIATIHSPVSEKEAHFL
ncbi:MAG TPA: hypothetical protein VK196_09360 [Magnetospirillum sp.]|nr:hypothetical protein [Magnetospirillum sp.]